MDSLHQDLIEIGLSEIEAKAYVAILNIGPASATNIARRADLKRPTTYLALGQLMKRGLVSEEFNRKKRVFHPASPERLRTIAKKQRRQAMATELKLNEILPLLEEARNRRVEIPRLSVFHGLEGVKDILETVSASNYSWYYFGAGKEIIKSLPSEELEDLVSSTVQLRAKAGHPKAYLITDRGIQDIPHFQNQRPDIREMVILKETIKSKSALVVFKEGIAILNFSEQPFGIMIQHREIAEILKLLYLMTWKSLAVVESKQRNDKHA